MIFPLTPLPSTILPQLLHNYSRTYPNLLLPITVPLPNPPVPITVPLPNPPFPITVPLPNPILPPNRCSPTHSNHVRQFRVCQSSAYSMTPDFHPDLHPLPIPMQYLPLTRTCPNHVLDPHRPIPSTSILEQPGLAPGPASTSAPALTIRTSFSCKWRRC